MKAIKITQEIKDKNKRYRIPFVENNKVDSIIKTSFPKSFYVTNPVSGSYASRTDLHDKDGWKSPIKPKEYNSSIHKLGNLKEVGSDFIYELIDKTEQELQNEIRNQSEANRQALITKKLEENALASCESETDSTILLENMDAFDFWETDTQYKKDKKLKRIVGLEVKLYKVNQPHTSQSHFPPEAEGVEALYSEISPPGVIPDWERPTGAHNAYDIDFEVKHNGFYWTSKISANTTEPTDANWQWWQKGDAV